MLSYSAQAGKLKAIELLHSAARCICCSVVCAFFGVIGAYCGVRYTFFGVVCACCGFSVGSTVGCSTAFIVLGAKYPKAHIMLNNPDKIFALIFRLIN